MSEPSRIPPRGRTRFKAVVHTEPEGGYWAEVADLPGCFTQGDTLDELFHNLSEAIACHLDLDTSEVDIGLLEMASES